MPIKLTPDQIAEAATTAGFEPRAVRAVIQVETGGSGYDARTGWLLTQFEPTWFKRLLPKAKLAAINAAAAAKEPTAKQQVLLHNWRITQANAVEGQLRERLAFDAATSIDPRTAPVGACRK
jgi:hypothetical protein